MKKCNNCDFEDKFGTRRSCPICGMPLIDFSREPEEYKERTRKEIIEDIKNTQDEVEEIIDTRIRNRLLEEVKKYEIAITSSMSNEEIKSLIKEKKEKSMEDIFDEFMKAEDDFFEGEDTNESEEDDDYDGYF